MKQSSSIARLLHQEIYAGVVRCDCSEHALVILQSASLAGVVELNYPALNQRFLEIRGALQMRNEVSFMKAKAAACLLMIVVACSVSAFGQQTTGAVRGIVTDPAGAVVPGAKVTISSSTINYRSETTTSAD